jgi:hypothetical protein
LASESVGFLQMGQRNFMRLRIPQSAGRCAWVVAEKRARHSVPLRFRANEARLQLRMLAYNLGNLWRRRVLPKRIDAWSLASLQQRLVKTGGRLLKHAR